MNDICACPICFLPYDQVTPVVAVCGHTLCESCSRMIVRNGQFQCPVCERVSPYPLCKNMELIHLLEFMQLQLDIPASKQIVAIKSNEISTSTNLSDMLLEEEGFVLTYALLRGNSVIMKNCAYSDKTVFSKELDLFREMCHPNLMQLLAYVHTQSSTSSTGSESECELRRTLIYEHAANGKLSTYLSSSKCASSTRSLLSKEKRLKIAIDVAQAVLYLQSQGSVVQVIATDISKLIESRYILLDGNYSAKLLVVIPHKKAAISPNNSTILPIDGSIVDNDANINTSTTPADVDISTKELLLFQNQDNSADIQVTKALGNLLLELLLNKEPASGDQTSSYYPDLISKPLSGVEFFEAIEAGNLGHPSMQQYCTEGLNGGVDKAFELFIEPLYRLAMACVDIHQHCICTMSTRQILLQLRQIRKALVSAMAPSSPPPVVEERIKSGQRTATTKTHVSRREKKASAAAKKPAMCASSPIPQNRPSSDLEKEANESPPSPKLLLCKSRRGRKGASAASSSANVHNTTTLSKENDAFKVTLDLPSVHNIKKVRKKSHHPGYYYNKTSTRPSDGVEVPASWRCCGKTSVRAMGCVYGPVSHHTGKWICAFAPRVDNSDELDETRRARRKKFISNEANGYKSSTGTLKWGNFDCCSVDTNDGDKKICKQENDQIVDPTWSTHAGCQQGPQPTPIRGGKSPHL